MLQGFRDTLPAAMLPKERVLQTAREVYRSYGYSPIETPALEYAEVLLGKGGGDNDRLVYRFKDHGDRDVALRFDLTVPFARFSAQHVTQLGTPFKRYAMGPVWRGERPGQGRYREFWQCDFDTIGTTSHASDIEVALVIHDLFAAMQFTNFQIRINNRKVLNGILEQFGLASKSTMLLRAIDKLEKIGVSGVTAELVTNGVPEDVAKSFVSFFGESEFLDNETTLEFLREMQLLAGTSFTNRIGDLSAGKVLIESGTRELTELVNVTKMAGIPQNRIKIDLSIARGLDYYTGTIYETFLGDLPGIGSVCSGGRYDNLAGTYTKQVLPGVGASLGVDRLLAAMEEIKHPWMATGTSPAPVLILQFDSGKLGEYHRIARMLRANGIGAEVFPEVKKVKAQFEYADKRGFRAAVIAGSQEFEQGIWKVKDMAKREEMAVKEAELVEMVRKAI